jgi:acylphosphatase
MDETLEAVVHGRVQGVGFRYFVQREAIALGLSGWVANEPDGSVRCVAIGDRTRLEAFAARLWDGPASAVVEGVDLGWRASTTLASPYPSFAVRSGAHRGD